LAVHAVYRLERALDLSGCVIRRLQSAHRRINENTEGWNIRRNGLAEREIQDSATIAKVYQANV
jgi:hypothetical protein